MIKYLDANIDVPRYKILVSYIQNLIAKGVYVEGSKLPTEKVFCERFNTSRTTVRRALIELEKLKLIKTKQGSGIFVQQGIYNQSLQKFYSFSKEMRKIGSTPSNKILYFGEIYASFKLAKIFELKRQSKILKIIRIRLANDEPFMYETTYLPKDVVYDLTEDLFENHDLYELMRNRYKVIFHKAIESFKAVLSNFTISKKLQIPHNSACMYLTRITYATHKDHHIVEYTESIARGDKFNFSVELMT